MKKREKVILMKGIEMAFMQKNGRKKKQKKKKN
jgi:hypothetical protein